MQATEIEEGLWHWTGPAVTTSRGSLDKGSVYYEAPDALVLVDPVAPVGAHTDPFWRALDRDVARVGLQVLVILTTRKHARDQEAIENRYSATTVQAWECGEHESSPAGRLPRLPTAVELRACGRGGERAIWLPRRRTIVAGTVIHGVDGVALSRDVGADAAPTTHAAEAELAALAELDPRHVLTCVGPPVLDVGGEALRRALS